MPGSSWRPTASRTPGSSRGTTTASPPWRGRSMLLQGRFLGLDFPFGVRISRTVDEIRDTDEGPLRALGDTATGPWSTTSSGGRSPSWWGSTWRVAGWCSASTPTPGGPTSPTCSSGQGFRIFGRRLQRRFAESALSRTRDYVEERLVREACLDAGPAGHLAPAEGLRGGRRGAGGAPRGGEGGSGDCGGGVPTFPRPDG